MATDLPRVDGATWWWGGCVFHINHWAEIFKLRLQSNLNLNNSCWIYLIQSQRICLYWFSEWNSHCIFARHLLVLFKIKHSFDVAIMIISSVHRSFHFPRIGQSDPSGMSAPTRYMISSPTMLKSIGHGRHVGLTLFWKGHLSDCSSSTRTAPVDLFITFEQPMSHD